MENQNFIYELCNDPKVLAYLGFMAVLIYFTKDKYR